MSKVITSRLGGLFTFNLYRSDGTLRRRLHFPNLILDQGLNRLGTGGGINHCRLGSGSSVPVVGQGNLDAQLGSSSTVQTPESGYDSVGNQYVFHRRTYRFAAGVATGNISEVGVGWTDSGSTLFSRALVLDGANNPTTITKLADEVLDVTYEVRLYIPGDEEFSFLIGATEHQALCRPANINSVSSWQLQTFLQSGISLAAGNRSVYSGAIGATVTDMPSGGQGGFSAAALGEYQNNSLERAFRYSATLDQANQLHRTYTLATNAGTYQVEINPTFTKLNTQIFTLDWKVGWGRRV